MTNLIRTCYEKALLYIKDGLSVIAVKENKAPIAGWKEYQCQIITPEALEKQFDSSSANGVAIICGAISGGLEVIDVDTKNDLTGELRKNIVESLSEFESLRNKLYITKTRSKGLHIYYRCEKIEGNQKLASRKVTDEELKNNPHHKEIVLIETRGEGGYVVAPPSEGYTIYQDNFIPLISPDEREILLQICRQQNQIVEDHIPLYKNHTVSDGYCIKPWTDYDQRGDVITLLQNHGWTKLNETDERIFFTRPGKTDKSVSGDYHKGLKLFKVFTTSSQFLPGKGYKPNAIFALLEAGGDFSKSASLLIKDGYGKQASLISEKIRKALQRAKEAEYAEESIIKMLVNDYGYGSKEAQDTFTEFMLQSGPVIGTFWNVDANRKITISPSKLERFLAEKGGFYLYFLDNTNTNYRLVKKEGSFITVSSAEQIKKFVKQYILSLAANEPFDYGITSEKLLDVIYNKVESLFSKNITEFLPAANFNFLQDNVNECFIPFKNGVVYITKNEILVKKYNELDVDIWKSEVIEFNISLDETLDYKTKKCECLRFVGKVSGEDPDKKYNELDVDLWKPEVIQLNISLDETPDDETKKCEYYRFLGKVSGEDPDKTSAMVRTIGYLLHKYKDPSKPYAIVLAEETEDIAKGGGTGKGIFIQALSKILKTEKLDGKNFRTDKSFAFQRIDIDTKLIAIDDLKKNVDFESLYSLITEGIPVEKKNQQEFYIPFSKSPKIILSTNYTVPSSGEHAKRRQRILEFYPEFNSNSTPADFFGHRLFDDWEEEEWNRFYNMMFLCVKEYLMDGIPEYQKSIKTKRKELKIRFSEEFVNWLDESEFMEKNDFVSVKDTYESFLSQSNFDRKEYSVTKFKKGIKEAAMLFGKGVEERRNSQNNNDGMLRIVETP